MWYKSTDSHLATPEKVHQGRQTFFRGAEATCNSAEWCALGFGLRSIADAGVHKKLVVERLLIQGDSQLVIRQLTGEYECHKERLAKFRDRAQVILTEIGLPWHAEWIPREENGAADALSREAWEEATGQKFPERPRKVKNP